MMTPPFSGDCEAIALRLAEIDPVLAQVISQVGPCAVMPAGKVDLFDALLRSIIYQQLHAPAAAAIHMRVLGLMHGRPKAAKLQALPDDALRAAGLSRNKLLAARDLAVKCLDGTVPNAKTAANLSDEELIVRLTAVRGIGPWSVHMLMIFYLGRLDIMPTGDFAIRKAFSQLYRRGRAVKPEAILRHSKRWQPFRSVASWYLWRSLEIPAKTDQESFPATKHKSSQKSL